MPTVIPPAQYGASQEEADRYMDLIDRNQEALALSHQGKLQEAEGMLRDILRDKPAAGFDAVSIARTKHELGRVLRKLGELDEAMELLQEALAVREQRQQDAGASTGMRDSCVTRDELAKVYEARGDCEMALQTRIPEERICSNSQCKSRDADELHSCSRCQCVFYCDESCQRDDGKRHNPLCKPRAAPAT